MLEKPHANGPLCEEKLVFELPSLYLPDVIEKVEI